MSTEPARSTEFYELFTANKALVVDTGAAARAAVAAVLGELGGPKARIHLASSYEAARLIINAERPRIVICDYNLEGASGIRLVTQAREALGTQAGTLISLLITSNANESSVAEAAEEEVDGYLLKPFTRDGLRSYIERTLRARVQPNPYRASLDEARVMLGTGDTAGARKTLESALKVVSTPALAYYYIGRSWAQEGDLDRSDVAYKKGLQHNPIHYRCLSGDFDALMGLNKNDEAYKTAKVIESRYPLSPTMLGAILRLAVKTGSFDDVDSHYDVYTALDFRPETLKRTMVSALVVAAKHTLKQKMPMKAAELFQRAAATALNNPAVIREGVLALCRGGWVEEAADLLNRFDTSDRAGPHFVVASFFVQAHGEATNKAIDTGRKLYQGGLDDTDFLELLAKMHDDAGQKEFADDIRARLRAKSN